MAFEFVCPYCHEKTLVDERFAGTSGPCVGCGHNVTIPQKNPSLATPSPAPPRPQFQIRSLTIGAFMLRILIATCMLALISWTIVSTVIPSFKTTLANRKRQLCLNNLQQIARALNAYREQYGTYPPPVVNDSLGRPLYSWRVLILPQMGYQQLYEQFQKDQPWDSPTNAMMVHQMPKEYASPASINALASGESNYSLLVGRGGLFPPTGPIDPKGMLDAPNETLLLVDTRDGAFVWTQPKDIDITNGATMGTRPMVDIGGNHDGYATAVTVDGTPVHLPVDMDTTFLNAIITPNGNESVDISSVTQPEIK